MQDRIYLKGHVDDDEPLAEFDPQHPWIAGRYLIVNPDGSDLSVADSSMHPAITLGQAPLAAIQGDPFGAEHGETLWELKSIGRGKYGVVVRARDPLGIPRAVKILDPRATPARGAADGPVFEQEIRLANKRPFKNVIAIMDYGRTEDARRPEPVEFEYYVSHFIDGVTLDRYFDALLERVSAILDNHVALDTTHDLILSVIDDVLSGLIELHDAGVVHMDIKPTNLMILPAPKDDALGATRHDRLFVIDLGTAKPVGDIPDGRTFAGRTRYYFPEHILPRLGCHDPDGDPFIEYDKLRHHWRAIDLYCLGRTLEQLLLDRGRRGSNWLQSKDSNSAELMERDAAKEDKWSRVLGQDFPVVEGLIDRLMAGRRPRFDSAEDARLAFLTVPRKVSRSALSSSTLTDQYRGLRIRAGRFHVRVAPPLDMVIDHPAFQRLRRLQQLTLVSEIFPDGTHTRFSHSLQTFHLAKRYLWSLHRTREFRLLAERRDVDHILAAALLHDIGQYQFSHTIEDLRKLADLEDSRSEHGSTGLIEKLRTIRHDQELAPEVMKRCINGTKSIEEMLREQGYSVADICYMFQKTEKSWQKRDALNLGRDIVSGLIDVDRVAYLVHDSERTGVPYGGAIDVGSLVDALTVHWEPAAKSNRVSLGVTEDGVSSVEAVLAALYWMYRNIYWRHSNRGFMAAVKFVMRTALMGELTFWSYVDAMYGKTEWDALHFLHQKYGDVAGKRAFNPLDSVVAFRRLGYQRVFTVGYRDARDLNDLWARTKAGISLSREDGLISGLVDGMGMRGIEKGQILVDVPLKGRQRQLGHENDETTGEKGARPSISVLRRDWLTKKPRRWVDIYGYSRLAEVLAEVEASSSRKIRVFMARDLVGRLPRDTQRQLSTRVGEILSEGVAEWGV